MKTTRVGRRPFEEARRKRALAFPLLVLVLLVASSILGTVWAQGPRPERGVALVKPPSEQRRSPRTGRDNDEAQHGNNVPWPVRLRPPSHSRHRTLEASGKLSPGLRQP